MSAQDRLERKLVELAIEASNAGNLESWTFLRDVLTELRPQLVTLEPSLRLGHFVDRVSKACEQNQTISGLGLPSLLRKCFPQVMTQAQARGPQILPPVEVTMVKSPNKATPTKSPQRTSARVNIAHSPLQDLFPQDRFEPSFITNPHGGRHTPTKLSPLSPGKKAAAAATSTAKKQLLSVPVTDEVAAGDDSSPDKAAEPAAAAEQQQQQDGDDEEDSGFQPTNADEAIAYFAGSHPGEKAKFLYLQPAQTDKNDFQPYKLKVVKRDEAVGEYFTMSSAGLVHVCNDDTPSEFISLSDWVRQSTMFSVLRKLTFFKHYMINKCFRIWRSNVRYQKYCEKRKQISVKLFLGMPTFCNTLVSLNQKIKDMFDVKLIAFNASITYQKNDFMDQQAVKLRDASKALEDVMDQLQKTVQRLCEEVKARANAGDESTGEGMDVLRIVKPSKTKSIFEEKLEVQERQRELRRAMAEAKMLPAFIRLIDYICVENLMVHTVDSHRVLLDILQNPRKNGHFTTYTSFGGDTVVFTPTGEDIIAYMQQHADDVINAVNGVSRLLFSRAMKPFLMQDRDTQQQLRGPHLATMLRQHQDYKEIRSSLESIIKEDFVKSVAASQYLEEYRGLYLYGKTWSVTEFYSKDPSVQDFADELQKCRKYAQRVEGYMRPHVTEGIFVVNSKSLKDLLTPIPTHIIDELNQLLLSTAKSRAQSVVDQVKTHTKAVRMRHTALQQFAEHLMYMESLPEEIARLNAESELVEAMYKLLDDGQVRIPLADSVMRDKLREKKKEEGKAVDKADESVFEEFGHELAAAETYYRETKLPTMISMLEGQIKQVNELTMQTLMELHGGLFADADSDAKAVLAKLQSVDELLLQTQEKIDIYSKYQALFGQREADYPNMRDARNQYTNRLEVWTAVNTWRDNISAWRNDPFKSLQPETIAKDTAEMYKQSVRMDKRANSSDLPAKKLRESVEGFKAFVPMLQELGNPALKQRHWEKIFKAMGAPYTDTFSFQDLLNHKVQDHKDMISELSAVASGEYGLELTLDKIKTAWANTDFIIVPHRDSRDVFILGGVDDIITLLEDNQATLATMTASRFVVGIRKDVEVWEKKLGLLSEIMDEWLTAQRSWMYLEVIFSQPDIQRQLPAEAAKFSRVDKHWKDIMRKAYKTPNVIGLISAPGLLEQFLDDNKLLDQIQKSLEDYLETKRVAFPRFYFLSNDELLEILSQTRDPQAVQPHLSKCFDNLVRLTFTEEAQSNEIVAMQSNEKEIVAFSNPCIAKGNVEHWLLEIEKQMKATLYDVHKACLLAYPKSVRKSWFFNYAAQPVLTIEQILWTNEVTAALDTMTAGGDKDALAKYRDKFVGQISEMVELVRSDLKPLERSIIVSLLVINVHARDVLDKMLAANCSSVNDFEWTRQLRYYWDEGEDNCVVRQTNTRFLYGYEYLGNTPRLVITPLTDRCYMTLTSALHLSLGGAPAGPAGTGKTETTKDLAKALARQCVVFNCSDGLDYKMMGRFFAGLAQAGAWACFDEFNRIDIEVLSVIAQQVMSIQRGLVIKADSIEFEGRTIALNMNYGCFITMNPGYAGRTELPDNLKALFRPVAMMIPDYGLIAEIMLFSEGFQSAKTLASKMVNLYKLSSEQLSQQSHYDFGMRAVKSVLVMAGALKRASPELSEDVVLIRAMRDSNVPKFLADDVPLFMAIIQDLFPGVEIPSVDYGSLQRAIENQCTLNGLQVVSPFTMKIIQLYETMKVRHGVMMVGATGTGKTSVYRTLQKALTQLNADGVIDETYQTVKTFILNPKSVRMGELYGEFNLVSHEWTDGLVASIARVCVSDTTPLKKWIVFDGPVDALWIENMNTVLDDNKMLCLANGERIKLPSAVTMMFEVQDLAVASPATVSRCGMVFMEPVHVGWRPVAKSWSATMEKAIPGKVQRVVQFLEDYVDETIRFVRRECLEKLPSVDINLVQSMLNLLDSLLVPAYGIKPDNVDDKLLDMYLVFSYVWAFGGNLHDKSTVGFDKFARERIGKVLSEFPAQGNVFDFYVDIESKTFKLWLDRVDEYEYNPTTPFFNILVPTVDTARYNFLLEALLNGRHNVLLGGETGVGKTVIAQAFLDKAGDSWASFQQILSAQTTSQNLQDVFESKLEKKRKTLLTPPAGKRMIFFIDDLNMPQLDRYGAQPPLELMRQTIGLHGFYDRKKLFYKEVADTQFICACAPAGGGRNAVTPRLLRYFNMFNIANLSVDSMKTIFKSILCGFLSRTTDSFAEGLSDVGSQIVDASVIVYQRITAELLPTPAKSHYTFNLRDLSKVVQGMLQIRPKNCPDKDTLLLLWCHEAARVFQDRLIDDKDKDWFNALLREMLSKQMGVSWKDEQFARVLFGDFRNREDRQYELLSDQDKLVPMMIEFLDDFNLGGKEMKLVFFRDALEHITRIHRIIRQPRGNALLVGVGGSGRQSLTRLAAHMAEYKLFQIEVTKSYNTDAFKEDIKKVLLIAGVKSEPIVFLFTDTQIVKESFLEDVNNILNSGEVPNLWANDEMERIIADVRPKAKEAGKLETKDVVYQHFVQLVRENLHMVLCFSPIGDAFRNRCRMFPSLVNCCTIDWFSQWPQDALHSVAKRFFESVDFGVDGMQDAISKLCMYIHMTVTQTSSKFYQELRRYNYTTPTSYLELINLYITMLSEQREMLRGKIQRLRGGLDVLAETNILVENMKVELRRKQPMLEQAAVTTANLLAEVSADQKQAQEVKIAVMKEEKEVAARTAEAGAIRDDTQRDLDKAMPAYYSAVKALKSLNKGDITEVKSFTKPPELVMTVMEAVCLLKGVKPTWEESKKLLGDAKFLESLETYDKDNIPAKMLQKVRTYTSRENFTPEVVAKVSLAAKSLCMWVRAMDVYAGVAKTVEPKKQKLAEAEQALKRMQAVLEEKQRLLAEVEARVQALKRKYDDSVAQKERIEADMNLTKVRLERAEKLVSGLGGEATRWKATAEGYEADRGNLVGDICLAAGYIAYIGPFTASYRAVLLNDWITKATEMGIAVDKNFQLERVLCDPVQIREWTTMGLPADRLSIENAILVTRGRRWPLMIDPQTQANRWIKNLEKTNNMVVTKLSDPKMNQKLENAIRIGQPVLLENVEETLDPALEPILQKQIYKSGGRMLIKLGDQEIDYSPDFRFYITSKLPNPHYLPEVCVKVTVINFTVTPKGLEDQLLGDVVRLERQDLEEQKDNLVLQTSKDQKSLKDLEDQILSLLSNASGTSILDDEVLINTLDASKRKSADINQRVKEAEETTKLIDIAREEYRGAATRGSLLYFVVADMAGVDPMYQYSLAFFKSLFVRVIEKTERADTVALRVKALIEATTETVYINICRGLFEKDKLLFSFLIACAIERFVEAIKPAEWNLFLRGPTVIDPERLPKNPHPSWLHTNVWAGINALEELSTFKGLKNSVELSGNEWHAFAETANSSTPLPLTFKNDIGMFQRMMVMKVFREERVVFSIKDYVMSKLGKRFIEPPPFDLVGTFGDSSALTPIIFVLSAGADPAASLQRLAEERGFLDRLQMISLGQGQGPIAERLIDQGVREGLWVCLQNCHLAASWMPDLEKKLEQLNGADVNEDFRLWLTSMPSKAFPVPVLQSGLKLTNEPPKGIKANLTRSFNDVQNEYYDTCEKPLPWKKMLFGLCFFHAVIQERRKFGAIGWNIPYEWNTSDLQVSIRTLRMFLEEQPEVPWDALKYMTGEIHYGGRVTDIWDLRATHSVLRRYFVPEALTDAYRFTPDGLYFAPPEGSLQQVKEYIAALPLEDSPEIFGLHPNADITFQRKETNALMDTIISIQPRIGAAAGVKSPEDVVLELVADLSTKIPKTMDVEQAHAVTFARIGDGTVNSLGTALAQEVIRFNRLLKVVSASLVELQRGIKGLVVMSSNLERMFNSFLVQRVPENWSNAAYPSLKPLGSWINDLIARVKFINDWLLNGPPNVFWISGFFFPQGFLTGVLQMHARNTKTAIDTLKFKTDVLPRDENEITRAADVGVYVRGNYLEGASWDREKGSLADPIPGELFAKMPVIWLSPESITIKPPEDTYDCPMYKTSTRAGTLSTTGHSTNYVVALHLKSSMPRDHWVRRGVAMLCMLDD